jgi:chitinase
MPLDQIVLGVPAYGHSFRVSKTSALKHNSTTQLNLYPPFDPNDTPAGDAWDDQPGLDECGNEQPQGGDITFWGLIQKGLLTSTGDVAPGVPNAFDNCSQTVIYGLFFDICC